MKTFYEWQEDTCLKFNFDVDETGDTQFTDQTLPLIKKYINDSAEAVYRLRMPWMRQQSRVSLKASYSTGTLTATAASATITGLSTVWTRGMEGQKIVITDGTDGVVVYRIKSFTSTTSLTLDTDYIHTGGSGLSYVIYHDVYTLPPDFKVLEVMKNVDPLDTYFDDDELLLSTAVTASLPSEMKFIGRRTTSYYSTGTIAITTNTTTVTGTDTVFDSTMVGRQILLGNYGRLYEITAVGSATSITIGENFGGATLDAGSSYQIDPPGLQQVRFHSTPSVAKIIPYTYWPTSIRLVNDNDVSAIPSESVLSMGAIWLWYRNEDSPLQQGAKANFDEAVAMLDIQEFTVRQKTMSPFRGDYMYPELFR